MVPNNVELLKLLWCPDDYEDGRVKPTAFRRNELSGQAGQHVSVDRQDIAKREVMLETLERQAEKANGKDIKREEAHIGFLTTSAVRDAEKDGAKMLDVVPEPIKGKNEAHCGIINIWGRASRGDLDMLRGKLAQLTHGVVPFEDAYR